MMHTYLGFAPVLVLAGALAAGGASAIQAQDTSQVRSDSSGYESYGPGDTSAAAAGDTGQADTGATGYIGPSTDTALQAKPGLQTGPAAGDTGTAGKRSATAADSVVCKDGSSSARTDGCLRNGGIDWDSTEAAMKSRGSPADTSSN